MRIAVILSLLFVFVFGLQTDGQAANRSEHAKPGSHTLAQADDTIKQAITMCRGLRDRFIEARIEACTLLLGFDSVPPRARATIFLNRGVLHFHKRYLDDARRDYDKAIELNPQYALAYVSRAGVHFVKGAYDDAIADYSRAIEVKPDYAKAYALRALSYMEQRNIAPALRDFDRAIELKPDYTIAYGNRALARTMAQRYDDALADFDRALELNPDFADALNNKAFLRVAAKDPQYLDADEAERLVKRAIEIRGLARYYSTLAAAYSHQGRFEEAVETQEEAISRVRAQGKQDKVDQYEAELELYRARKPYR